MLGQRIREVREVSGLTSSQVSVYLRVDLKIYLMMENDEFFVKNDTIEKLCRLYGVDEKVFYNKNEKIDCLKLGQVNVSDFMRIARITKMYAQIR